MFECCMPWTMVIDNARCEIKGGIVLSNKIFRSIHFTDFLLRFLYIDVYTVFIIVITTIVLQNKFWRRTYDNEL